ncbi:hypothetical protein BDV98DRAFT_512112 [Pterulicium gracile]|uniref:Uncharacterized protein n=1 Tax=Pterulicium gracile TaxID=1884261 RepID=A0A5C3Q947_9AGAR|nr:hypothetical protein BDV98DRAFT_512112 [Pterula gracilis]
MALLTTSFKLVSLFFALSAVGTGLQALLDPLGFSRSFGVPNGPNTSTPRPATSTAHNNNNNNNPLLPYVSLMGVRQLATGLTLLLFASLGKWAEMAMILGILGFVVACTDGYFLFKAGNERQALFHALPGALIASLAMAYAVLRE